MSCSNSCLTETHFSFSAFPFRIQWGGTINRSFDLVRGGLAYIGHDNDYKMNKELTDAKTELTLRTIAFARCLKVTRVNVRCLQEA